MSKFLPNNRGRIQGGMVEKTMNFSSDLQSEKEWGKHATTEKTRAGLWLQTEMNELDPGRKKLHIGLCADCQFMRPMTSDRGSVFYLCERSATDAAFPKYPRLPVLHCSGFENHATTDGGRAFD